MQVFARIAFHVLPAPWYGVSEGGGLSVKIEDEMPCGEVQAMWLHNFMISSLTMLLLPAD